MKKRKISLKIGLLTIIVACWLIPIILVVTLTGVLFGRNYQKTVQQEIDAGAENALRQIQMQLENAIIDSKTVSYDGIIRSVYRDYQQSGDRAALYRGTNDYLNQNFARKSQYRAVAIHFLDTDVSACHLCSGTTGYELLNQCRKDAPFILDQMGDVDTGIRFLALNGQLYMARNLLDSSFVPYATIVMMLDAHIFFQPLEAINRISDMYLTVDDAVFSLTENGILSEADASGEISYSVKADGHVVSFTARMEQYNLWKENPWILWVTVCAALLVLPLLGVMIFLFSHHVTRPIETLVQANMQVQSGHRGYEISAKAPNAEFEKLYSHFNAMSTEMQSQFERSYQEQRATQKAQIKALQSQINPHFLNNTLEIINWEARLAGNDRVSAMIEALSTMLDAALDRDGRTQIPLKEELGYVDAYQYIIRERLGEGFFVHKDIAPEALEQMIPRLILQPIVENAVEHDITSHHGGNLSLRAFRRDCRMVLEVEHDGTMTDADRENIRNLLSIENTAGRRVGLRNVYRRLKLLYGEEGSLTIDEVSPGVILASVVFPCG